MTNSRALKVALVLLVAALWTTASVERAWAHSIREPAPLTVTLHNDGVSAVSARGQAAGDFVKIQLLADFGCPSGHIVRELRMSTPYDWKTKDVSSSSALSLANQTMPWALLASVSELRKACKEGKSKIDVPVRLTAVCASKTATSISQGIQTPAQTHNVAVNLSCTNVTTPRYVVAKIAPSQFLHDCPGTASGIEGTNQPSRVSTSARPLQCGSTYAVGNPKLTRVRPYESKHFCASGWVLDGYVRSMLKFDRAGGGESEYGVPRWCHSGVAARISEVSTVTVGEMEADLRSSQPSFSVTRNPKLRFKPLPPPKPSGMSDCKRGEFRLLDENQVMSLQSGGSFSCSSSLRTVDVQLGFPGAQNAAKMLCINEANRLKQQGQWTSLPSAGTARRFTVSGTFGFGLVGRYCFSAGGSFDCAQRKHQSEWGGMTSAKLQVKCWAK